MAGLVLGDTTGPTDALSQVALAEGTWSEMVSCLHGFHQIAGQTTPLGERAEESVSTGLHSSQCPPVRHKFRL